MHKLIRYICLKIKTHLQARLKSSGNEKSMDQPDYLFIFEWPYNLFAAFSSKKCKGVTPKQISKNFFRSLFKHIP